MSDSTFTSAEHLPSAVVVHVLARNLYKAEIDAVCTGVDEAMAPSPKLPVILDMAKVAFAGSVAMGTLVGLHKEFATRGQRLIIVGLQGPLQQAINVTKMHTFMEFMTDVSSALKSIEAAG